MYGSYRGSGAILGLWGITPISENPMEKKAENEKGTEIIHGFIRIRAFSKVRGHYIRIIVFWGLYWEPVFVETTKSSGFRSFLGGGGG